jgi:hypothetical protein
LAGAKSHWQAKACWRLHTRLTSVQPGPPKAGSLLIKNKK